MTVLSFILGIVISVIVLFVGLCWLVLHYNTNELEKENAKLKDQIAKLRKKTRVNINKERIKNYEN